MKTKKTFDNRVDDEKKEGYDEVQTKLPKGRFQETKQVLKPDELGVGQDVSNIGDSVTGEPKVKAAKLLKSKIKIAPDASFEELNGKQVGGVPLAPSIEAKSVAGFTSSSVADDRSKIPYSSGNYRPETRYGKKRSEQLFELDNTISEQVVPIVDDLPDLKDNPDSPIGYNGRKQFKQTRAKKNFKFKNGSNVEVPRMPAQLLNESSVDFITTDKLVYSSGQMIKDAIEKQANYPTVTMLNGEAVPVAPAGHTNDKLEKSNYMPTKFGFTIADGHITDIFFKEDRYDVEANPIARDQANFNAQVDANNIAKTMVKIQNEMGRETTDKWTPLAYVIHEPYEYNMLLHDIESTTGAMAAAAYRAAVSGLAYQKNIIAKDGINPQRNAVKMIMEGYLGELTNNEANSIPNTNFGDVIFNQKEYRKGSPAAIIDMFDSVKKYRTKADLLGLQRSFGLHLAQADNNLNPLHCKPEFIKALDKAHMFSTISGNYNPMLPIFETNRIAIMNPLSLQYFLAGWKNPALFDDTDRADINRDQLTGTYSRYVYEYADIRNKYTTRVQHPLVEGLIRWLLKHEGAVVSTFGTGTVNMPAIFNMKTPTLFAFILCSALQDIVWERNIIFRDVLFAGEQSTYIWDDLQGLDRLNPLYSTQLTIGSYNDPLKLGKLANDAIIRELWATHMPLVDVDNAYAQYILPWYFNERAFGAGSGSYTRNEGFYNEPTAFNMSFPSIRDGIRHEYIDAIKSMDLDDVRLALDRWVDIPLFDEVSTVEDSNHANLYDLHVRDSHATAAVLDEQVKFAALRYDGNSDGRVVVSYQCDKEGLSPKMSITYYSLYLVPKEIGFIDDLYAEVKAFSGFTVAADGNNAPNITPVSLAYPNADVDCGSEAAYSGYSPLRLTSYRVDSDAYTDKAIDRSAALTQTFCRFYASPEMTAVNAHYVERVGIIPTIGYLDGAIDDFAAVYNLDSINVPTNDLIIDKTIRSYSRRVWSVIQRVFFPIDRFANCFTINRNVHAFDPMEACMYFGFCGTLAADYTQCVLERLDVYDQLGLDYTEDVNVKKSLIFR